MLLSTGSKLCTVDKKVCAIRNKFCAIDAEECTIDRMFWRSDPELARTHIELWRRHSRRREGRAGLAKKHHAFNRSRRGGDGITPTSRGSRTRLVGCAEFSSQHEGKSNSAE